jgi:small subunit ribosomal protein S20
VVKKSSPEKGGNPDLSGCWKGKTFMFVPPNYYFMPNTKSAGKAMRQAARRRTFNLITKDKFKEAVKEVKKLITAGKKSEAMEAMKKAMSTLDKATKKNVIKKNTASRKKSRLALAIAKLK